MSFSAQNWAWDQRCKTGIAKMVLLYLANCADRNGECFPGILKIVKNVQHTERAVRQAILDLLEWRQIEAERQWMENGRCTSTRYRLPVAVDHCENAGVAPAPAESQDYCGNAGVGDYCGNAGETPAESQGNPITLTKEEEKTPPLTPRRRGERVSEDDRFDDFWKDYPKKEDKGKAYKAYVRALKAVGGDPDDILDALFEAKQENHRFRGDYQFIPYPATWLNAGPWHAPKPKMNGGGEAAHAH
jgi:hypothetical protein